MRVGGAVHNHLALVHDVTVMDQNVFLLGDQELMGIAVEVGDDQTLLALGVFTERDRTGDFGEHAGVFRGTGFEQFDHTRQTAGNVASLLRFFRSGKNGLNV